MSILFKNLLAATLFTACGGTGKIIVEPNTDTDEAIDTSTPDTDQTDTAPTPDTGDTDPVDTDTADTVDTEPVETPISCMVNWTFLTPIDYEFYSSGNPVDATVQIDPLDDYAGHTVRWENPGGQVLADSTVDSTGQALYSGIDYSASKGLKTIFARLVTPEGPCDTTVERRISVCDEYILEEFTTESIDWVTRGDAYWDPNGWVEMTGTSQGQKGAVYNKVEAISSGAASIRFTIKTGNGMNGGADGFAFTIMNISSLTDLETWISEARSGGGMGYGVGGPSGTFTGEALTVEIDTWHNSYNGTNELHTDPTTSSHIALTQNADPGDHLVFFETPNVEDFQPHDLRVDIVPNAVKVSYDGTEVINENPQLNFKGGQMFFSGSTGWATNNHIFDNLEIFHDCQ